MFSAAFVSSVLANCLVIAVYGFHLQYMFSTTGWICNPWCSCLSPDKCHGIIVSYRSVKLMMLKANVQVLIYCNFSFWTNFSAVKGLMKI